MSENIEDKIITFVRNGKSSTTDIVASIRSVSHAHSPAKVTATVLRMVNEGRLTRGEHRTIVIPKTKDSRNS